MMEEEPALLIVVERADLVRHRAHVYLELGMILHQLCNDLRGRQVAAYVLLAYLRIHQRAAVIAARQFEKGAVTTFAAASRAESVRQRHQVDALDFAQMSRVSVVDAPPWSAKPTEISISTVACDAH